MNTRSSAGALLVLFAFFAAVMSASLNSTGPVGLVRRGATKAPSCIQRLQCPVTTACSHDSDCRIGLVCLNRLCTSKYLLPGEQCSTASQCYPQGSTCPTSSYKCVAPSGSCTTSKQCSVGQYCSSGSCIDFGTKEECDTPDACGPGQTCNFQTCVHYGAIGQGGSCSSQLACQAGYVCWLSKCVTPSALTGPPKDCSLTDCPRGQECVCGKGKAATCAKMTPFSKAYLTQKSNYETTCSACSGYFCASTTPAAACKTSYCNFRAQALLQTRAAYIPCSAIDKVVLPVGKCTPSASGLLEEEDDDDHEEEAL